MKVPALWEENEQSLIAACLITGVYDVNRNTTLNSNDDSLFSAWANSIADLGLHGIIFHSELPQSVCEKYQNEHIRFVKIEYDPRFNPNVFRYFVYRDFLLGNHHTIQNLFITDISDVVVLRNPFEQQLFRENPGALFCGDEPKKLANQWMTAHSEHLRVRIGDYTAYEQAFAEHTLLNCGVIGGKLEVMTPFLNGLCQIHDQHNRNNPTTYTGDMGAFNYVVRTRFNDRIISGPPVNTVFKAYETGNHGCWFRHK